MTLTAQAVRDILTLQNNGNSKYTDGTILSNVRAAQAFLERATHRYFVSQTKTLTFTSEGRASVPIPGLRTPSSVVSNSTTLSRDESYWLIPDAQQTGVYAAVQLRAFANRREGPWYLSNPEWFDRNLDSPLYPGNYAGSAPNDLVITGDWGYTDPPEPFLLAQKFLAAFWTLRPDALLSGGTATPEGNVFDLSHLPDEVQQFVADWALPSDPGMVVSV